MKTVQIKNITVGEGAPKIIVSLMAKDLAAVKSEAAAYAAADFDILEWRGDHFAAVTDSAAVICQSKPCIDAQPVPIVALLDELIEHLNASPQSYTTSDFENFA